MGQARVAPIGALLVAETAAAAPLRIGPKRFDDGARPTRVKASP